MLKLIVAVGPNGCLGSEDNGLLYEDATVLARFKRLTMDDYVLMGNNTYRSIPKSLKGRREILVTRKPMTGVTRYGKKPFIVASDMSTRNEILNNLYSSRQKTVWVGGGKMIYEWFMKNLLPEELHITRFHRKPKVAVGVRLKGFYQKDLLDRYELVQDVPVYSEHPHNYEIWKRKDLI